MPAILLRLGILLLACLVTLFIVQLGRSFVEQQRRQALAALHPPTSQNGSAWQPGRHAAVQILAFSSEDCHQCHQLQTPALKRVQEALGDRVGVEEIDAPSSPELTRRFHILTVPSTVILDADGSVLAVNYGFANAQKLIAQVQEAFMQGQTA